MAERLNAAVLKTVEGASPPGVRILSPPPVEKSGRDARAVEWGGLENR